MRGQVSNIDEIEAIAKSVARAVGAGDLDALRLQFTPDACIWHNTDNREKTLDEGMEQLGGMIRLTSRRWLDDVRLAPTPTGYVEQHYVRGVTLDGQDLCVPVCMVITLSEGRISRLDEYFDASAAASHPAGQEAA